MDNQSALLNEYDAWFDSTGLKGFLARQLFGTFGLWAASTPLIRLPEELSLTAKTTHLDIGSGTGALARHLSLRTESPNAPVLIDFSSIALKIARENKPMGMPDRNTVPHLLQATATDIPLKTATFNLITCGYVAKHLDETDLFKLFSEAYRLLTPGGLFLLWEFGPSGNKRLDRWNSFVLSRYVSQPILRSTETLQEIADDAGFGFYEDARLRPFLFPPIPRASILAGKPPEGFEVSDRLRTETP
ncbi:MAG: class I SAM-dependent methyltransferase [Dehalococcoidia bacterium]|nr:class I SAM-dependent methyltransferase [Dehalococcoidia bacterium]